ncbi:MULTISPECIES: hypothetical protein [unclassified Paenibacillus]|uniref:hypothetical protein n=1 Tax=unclassified Paenibacillus TaxID=185978 RepID=UPI0027829142|nr:MULTISPECIES: hypothetical protein [unclassified Paenibacillus]MDQ0896262.1 hypothetical protein [Paenibacillus sp. V4I7]MDQ0913810.1 hypothetical protein [Paenibacillus sp. V4I5]
MEIAKLVYQEINIAEEWFKQATDGSSRETIVRSLEDKYRIHSQKDAFVCLCCNQPVRLVLREESPHFRHHGDRCPSAENYTKYIHRIRSGENTLTHRVGRTILRAYLEGQLKPRGVILQEGYMYRSALKIVPDFILTFPNGTKWSVDYVTGKREDNTYNNYISKRTSTYQAAGFRPFYFINADWIADVPDRSIVSLYLAESQMKIQSSVDQQWSAFVKEFYETFDASFVLREMFGVKSFGEQRLTPEAQDVFSLAYIDPSEGRAWIERFIPTNKKFGYHIHRASISLEKATSLSEKLDEFQWWGLDETEDMRACLERLTHQYEAEQAAIAEREADRLEALKRKREEAAEYEERMKRQRELAANLTRRAPTTVPTTALQPRSVTTASTKVFGLPAVEIASLVEKITLEMTAAEARRIHSILSPRKSSITKPTLEQIRAKARMVLGPNRNLNPIPHDLRKALIDLALL